MLSPHLRLRSSLAALCATAGLSLLPTTASAAPTLRHQADLRGDVVVFGSTQAFDCGAGLAVPAGATASCAGQLSVTDTAPDLYWRDGIADASILPTQARTSATLTLPQGASVTYARLYWAGLKPGQAPDTSVVLDWLGGPTQAVAADDTTVIPYAFPAHPDWYYYQASGDATDFVATWGAGDFRVTDIEAVPLVGIENDRAFSAWTLVVFYEKPGDELRNLALFDGFMAIDPGLAGQGSAAAQLSGFLVPQGFSARMTAFAYEGDATYTGDHFTFNGTQVANAQNPADNFFNSSRSYAGAPVSGSFDVPALSGAPGSMAGYDLDTVDITSLVSPGDTSAVVGADSSLDIFFLGGFVTSVTSLAPDFKLAKSVVDLDGGAVLPGDVLEYVIATANGGNDASAGTILTDVLDTGLAFQPGSISVVSDANPGQKTDASGDDQGEYDAASRTVRVRLGTGADAILGGSVAVGAAIEVRFRVVVQATTGVIANQAVLRAAGAAGAPEKTYLSDGDPATIGEQSTITPIDECNADADCPKPKPHCNLTTHVCQPCQTDGDCSAAASPACQPNGSCGQCSATNATLCTGAAPVCNVTTGSCVLCTLGPSGDASQCATSADGPVCVDATGGATKCGCLADGDCGHPTSGKVCDSIDSRCKDGCRGNGGNGCPTQLVCTSPDTTIGACVPGGGDAENDAGPEAGPDAGPDAGAGGSSAGGSAPQSGDDGGCGCRVGAAGERSPGAALSTLLGLVGAGIVRRRRRR